MVHMDHERQKQQNFIEKPAELLLNPQVGSHLPKDLMSKSVFWKWQRKGHVRDWKDEYKLSQQSHLDAEWTYLQQHLPAMPKRGRPPTHVAREPALMRSSLCCARAAPGAPF